MAIDLIEEAFGAGARRHKACAVLGIDDSPRGPPRHGAITTATMGLRPPEPRRVDSALRL